MSIRLRLTLWYAALLAVILVIFSGALYGILSFSLLNEVDRTLETRAAEVQNSATAALQVQSDPLGYLLSGRLVVSMPGADAFSTPGIYVQVAGRDGTPVSRSDNLGNQAFAISGATLNQVVGGGTVFTNLSIGKVPLRMYAAPLVLGQRVYGVIEVAESLQGVNDTLRRLATMLTGGILVGLAVSAIGGAFLARSALAPIDHLTQTARTIAHSGDLTGRIERVPTQDELGRLAGTFNEMLDRIEEQFRKQKQFVADVSHELRSPLTVIQGNLDLLRRVPSGDAEGRRAALAAIESESARMQRLVADLLVLARADAGVELPKQTVELDTLLLDVYRQARMMSQGVKVSLGGEDEAQVIGDPDRLKQLLLNLVDNALKYTPNGGEVRLSLERDTQWVRVSVSDTGVGIPADELPKIFDRFYRVDKARSRGKGGTGLGLAIAKWIVDAHNGRIDVKSEVGKGTTFVVWLPLAPSGNGAHQEKSAAEAKRVPSLP